VPLDPLQAGPQVGWPDLDGEGPVGWLPARGESPRSVVVQVPPADGPPPWAVPAGLHLVREIQKLVPAGAAPAAVPAGGPVRRGVATYRPFGGR
jgi:hypothetical protein